MASPLAVAQVGVCALCGCTFLHPCLGGLLYPPPPAEPHRLVPDRHVLARGDTCFWMDDGETICSAHTFDELEAAGIDTTEMTVRFLEHDEETDHA